MKEYLPGTIRNCAIIGHATVGKTSLSEAILFTAGEANRLGKVDDGSTTSDYNVDEISRKISISSSLLHCAWKNCKLNILDTPGFSDFIGEVMSSLRVAELGIVVVSGVSGIEVGTEIMWRSAQAYKDARLIFVNRLDKEHADFKKCVDAAQARFGKGVVPVHIPINAGENFDSFIDILRMVLVKYEKDGSGKHTTAEIPAQLKQQAEEAHEKLVELAAESDDKLIEKFFEEGTLTIEEIKQGLKAGVAKQNIFPILCGAAAKNIGTHELLDFVAEYGPSPQDREPEIAKKPKSNEQVRIECKEDGHLAALVFKTVSEAHVGELSFFKVMSGKMSSGIEVLNSTRHVTEKIGQIYLMNGKNRKEIGTLNAGDIAATVKLRDTHTGNTLCDKRDPVELAGIEFPDPVIRVAIEPKTKGDEDKLSVGLHSLHEQDPTFVSAYDPELRQTIISGQGEVHLDIVVKRLKDRFGVEVNLTEPRIPYRETIRGRSEAQGKYKKQSGGRGQYGDCWLKLEPLPRGAGFEFEDAIVGGVIPGKYVPAVEKGVREALEEGVIAGYQVTDLKVTVFDGSYHDVDSSEMAFKIAGSMGFKKAFQEAKPVLLEPIYEIEVIVPEEFMGDVMGDLSSRRGKISGMEAEGPFQVIKAKVPLAEIHRYSTALRSLTQGRGNHRRKFSHYEDVPHEVTQKLVAAAEEAKNK